MASFEQRRKAVFLDLNGTLVLPIKPDRLDDLAPIPGAIAAVARLTRAGFVCPVITVQSRIAKRIFSADDFGRWFGSFADRARSDGAELDGPYVCPHRYADPCACKKPNPLLYERAIEDLGIATASSYVVGDSPEDMQAANRLGIPGCLVRTGWAADPSIADAAATDAAHIADSIVDAVDWILSSTVSAEIGDDGPPV